MNTIKIISAKYLFDYRIEFQFSSGKVVIVDFEDFLSDPHANPMSRKYLNIERFKKFKILFDRDISWGKHREMCFQFKTLYKGGKVLPIDRKKLKKSVIKYFGQKKADKMFAEADMI